MDLCQVFETVVARDNESKIANYEYVTELDYQENKTIIKYTEEKNGTEIIYMTDLSITNKNIKETIYIGRKRWKIKNEGFNVQKNRTFDIGHLYSKNATAIKVHYLMIQIAHILRQLLENGIKEIIEDFQYKINYKMIRNKIYKDAKVQGKYNAALDGSRFQKAHYEVSKEWLKETKEGKTNWYVSMLELKLVANSMAISLMSEMIKNEDKKKEKETEKEVEEKTEEQLKQD